MPTARGEPEGALGICSVVQVLESCRCSESVATHSCSYYPPRARELERKKIMKQGTNLFSSSRINSNQNSTRPRPADTRIQVAFSPAGPVGSGHCSPPGGPLTSTRRDTGAERSSCIAERSVVGRLAPLLVRSFRCWMRMRRVALTVVDGASTSPKLLLSGSFVAQPTALVHSTLHIVVSLTCLLKPIPVEERDTHNVPAHRR
jgi:hypothetical protein